MHVRELAALARGLDVAAFERQMGPFALMQRPPPESWLEYSTSGDITTSPNPALQLKSPPAAIDFGDLLVTLLPPPKSDGSLELIVGRAPDCELIVEDTHVSKRHAVIRWSGSAGVISELGSANGTFIGGHRMKDSWTLRDGEEISFGKSHFTYLLAASLHGRLRALR